MSKTAIIDVLNAHPLFENLNPQCREVIANYATDVHFDYGQYIFRQGETSGHFFMIRHGAVSVENHTPDIEPVTIQTLGKEDVFGCSWLYPPFERHFDARAIEHTSAISMDANLLRNLMDEDREIGYELMTLFSSIMLERLHAAQRQLLELYGALQKQTDS